MWVKRKLFFSWLLRSKLYFYFLSFFNYVTSRGWKGRPAVPNLIQVLEHLRGTTFFVRTTLPQRSPIQITLIPTILLISTLIPTTIGYPKNRVNIYTYPNRSINVISARAKKQTLPFPRKLDAKYFCYPINASSSKD